jgi:hypothetical protein
MQYYFLNLKIYKSIFFVIVFIYRSLILCDKTKKLEVVYNLQKNDQLILQNATLFLHLSVRN